MPTKLSNPTKHESIQFQVFSTIIIFKLSNEMKPIKTKFNQTDHQVYDHLRTREAPPLPSPVPTGKGLRSSVINDEILSDFLTASLQIPDLKLPVTFQSRHVNTSPVDYQSIVAGDCDAIENARQSAFEFGFFVVSGHGVTSTDVEAEARKGDEKVRERNRRREAEEEFDFCWSGEDEEDDGSEFYPDFLSDPNFRNFSERKEAELVKVGESISKIFYKGTSFGAMQAKASTSLMILKCNVDYQLSKLAFLNVEDDDNVKHCKNESALSLYLVSSKCEILVQADTDSFIFQAPTDTIVAILGQQLHVECNVKNLPRKLRFLEPVDAQGCASHALGLVVSIGLKLDRIISVTDQIMVAALTTLLFQFGIWFCKCVQSLSWFG